MKTLKESVITCLVVLVIMMTTSCDSIAKTDALIGAGLGAALGAGIDHNNRGRGAAIGAGVGIGAGYIYGNEQDKKNSNSY
jgi:hypothetical protein